MLQDADAGDPGSQSMGSQRIESKRSGVIKGVAILFRVQDCKLDESFQVVIR